MSDRHRDEYTFDADADHILSHVTDYTRDLKLGDMIVGDDFHPRQIAILLIAERRSATVSLNRCTHRFDLLADGALLHVARQVSIKHDPNEKRTIKILKLVYDGAVEKLDLDSEVRMWV